MMASAVAMAVTTATIFLLTLRAPVMTDIFLLGLAYFDGTIDRARQFVTNRAAVETVPARDTLEQKVTKSSLFRYRSVTFCVATWGLRGKYRFPMPT